MNKHNFRNEALDFISEKDQVNCKLSHILTELTEGGAPEFANAVEDLTVNEIIEAALIKDVAKWSQKIEEIEENQAIIRICPDAKIRSNTYEEIRLSVLEITDSQIHELSRMFNEHSIKITVEYSSLLVIIIKDSESR